MIFVLLVLTILGIVIPVRSYIKEKNDDTNSLLYDLEDFSTDHLAQFVLLVLSTIATLICCGAVCYLLSACLEGSLLGRKIEMLQTQNADIEGKIEVVVKEYMSYENQTYLDLKPSQMVIFAASYPALQSNNLVQEQIKTYQDNNNKIIDLKNKQIENSLNKWWLYFGGDK